MLHKYDLSVSRVLLRFVATVTGFAGVSLLVLFFYPLLGVSFFPCTDGGQFVINVKAPSGTCVELIEDYVKQVEDIVRQVVAKPDLGMIVSNIGIIIDFSAIYILNFAPHTAFI